MRKRKKGREGREGGNPYLLGIHKSDVKDDNMSGKWEERFRCSEKRKEGREPTEPGS